MIEFDWSIKFLGVKLRILRPILSSQNGYRKSEFLFFTMEHFFASKNLFIYLSSYTQKQNFTNLLFVINYDWRL